jgi:hypothetical protein
MQQLRVQGAAAEPRAARGSLFVQLSSTACSDRESSSFLEWRDFGPLGATLSDNLATGEV